MARSYGTGSNASGRCCLLLGKYLLGIKDDSMCSTQTISLVWIYKSKGIIFSNLAGDITVTCCNGLYKKTSLSFK